MTNHNNPKKINIAEMFPAFLFSLRDLPLPSSLLQRVVLMFNGVFWAFRRGQKRFAFVLHFTFFFLRCFNFKSKKNKSYDLFFKQNASNRRVDNKDFQTLMRSVHHLFLFPCEPKWTDLKTLVIFSPRFGSEYWLWQRAENLMRIPLVSWSYIVGRHSCRYISL